ncbi:MAG: ArsR family transcriptional regulator [Candidatus Hodarchaeales archaeon]|jgi:DNA-binding MarR family transcriptional regulator
MAATASYVSSIDTKHLLLLPKSARQIYKVLKSEGAMKPNAITERTDLSARTVRYGLKRLVDHKIVGRFPDLHDLRSHYYRLI